MLTDCICELLETGEWPLICFTFSLFLPKHKNLNKGSLTWGRYFGSSNWILSCANIKIQWPWIQVDRNLLLKSHLPSHWYVFLLFHVVNVSLYRIFFLSKLGVYLLKFFLTISCMLAVVIVGGLNVEGEADSWDFGVGMSLLCKLMFLSMHSRVYHSYQ